MVLPDTHVLTEVLRPRPSPAVIGRLLQFTSKTQFASEVTRFEMRFGLALRPNASLFWARIQRELLPLVTWLPVSEAVSTPAGDLAAAQRLAGRPCGTLAPLIAATAPTRGLPLATRNVQHFDRIEGLEVQNGFSPKAD